MNEQGETATCLPTLLSGVLTSSLLKYFTPQLKAADTHETLAVYPKIHGLES
jgi:hypothetical protein